MKINQYKAIVTHNRYHRFSLYHARNSFIMYYRLRHEKLRPIKEDRGGPSEYRMLRCFDLDPTPQPKPPKLTMNKEDPLDFFSGEQVEVME